MTVLRSTGSRHSRVSSSYLTESPTNYDQNTGAIGHPARRAAADQRYWTPTPTPTAQLSPADSPAHKADTYRPVEAATHHQRPGEDPCRWRNPNSAKRESSPDSDAGGITLTLVPARGDTAYTVVRDRWPARRCRIRQGQGFIRGSSPLAGSRAAHPLPPALHTTSGSWRNLVEHWFAEQTNRKLRRFAHRSVTALEKYRR